MANEAKLAPLNEPASSAYWQAMSGFNYQTIVGDRRLVGQQGYGQQESFLAAFVAAEQRQLGRPMDILEFGCGFGRHAWYLSEQSGVRYHGYDFSEEMVAPLRKVAPAALEPLTDHLFVGSNVGAAVGERRFDLIFTVSVLIHNPPERLPRLLDQMSELLTPGGTLCLVENQIVPFGVYENNWHDGCWLHRYWDIVGTGWDLHVAHGFVDTHDIYFLRRNGRDDRRLFNVPSPQLPLDGSQPLSEVELDLLGLPKLRKWAHEAEPFLRGEIAPHRDQLWDQEEVLRSERERVERQRRLLTLADDLHEIRMRPPPKISNVVPIPVEPPAKPCVELGAALDTHWAHVDPDFRRVLHVFAQEWHGIRAAAGYLPGAKLAIAAERPLTDQDRRVALEAIFSAMTRAVVVHGWSQNMYEIVQLAKKNDPTVKFFGVWHGSSAQFFSDFEFEAVSHLLEMRRTGVLERLATVKPGMELMSDRIHSKALLNVGPRLPEGRPAPREPLGAALVPVANDWRKNFYTNVYAAAGEPRFRTVYVTAPHRTMGALSFPAQVVAVARLGRAALFRLTRDVDLSLNATLSECQPMTALEALAHGVPCLTGPLALGELDEHPYQRLSQIAQVDTISEVRRAVSRICDLRKRDPIEMEQMMVDYEIRLQQEALARYREFLAL